MTYKYKVMIDDEVEYINDKDIDNRYMNSDRARLLVVNSKLNAKYPNGTFIVEGVDENNEKITYKVSVGPFDHPLITKL